MDLKVIRSYHAEQYLLEMNFSHHVDNNTRAELFSLQQLNQMDQPYDFDLVLHLIFIGFIVTSLALHLHV